MFGLYAGAGETYFLLSCDPVFARAYFTTRRPGNQPQPPAFCSSLRSKLDGTRLVKARQVGFDRILHLDFEGAQGEFRLIAELMGKHSNLILVGADGRIVSSAKVVGASKSSRVVAANRPYEPPPTPPRPTIFEARMDEDLSGLEGASPFLVRLIEAMTNSEQALSTHPPGTDPVVVRQAVLREIQNAVLTREFDPVLSGGHGAYPLSVAPLGLPELSRSSISIALEQHFATAIPAYEAAQLKGSLLAQLRRVLLARELAVSELSQARDAGDRAGKHQLLGELILAYGFGLEPASKELTATDYEGNPVIITLDPELTPLENANRYFEKAKKAKQRLPLVLDQLARLEEDRARVDAFLRRVEDAERFDELRDLQAEARERKWLHSQPAPTAKKEDRPYEGHRIRELIGPGGVTILYGENATSNDYLTLRVAKPDDWWLHVRGGISAHVVIPTKRHPEKVQKEALLYAAKVAVQNSPSKHSGYVPVDYTLRKYVRKPRGAPAGTALYTHEKTLHVEP